MDFKTLGRFICDFYITFGSYVNSENHEWILEYVCLPYSQSDQKTIMHKPARKWEYFIKFDWE